VVCLASLQSRFGTPKPIQIQVKLDDNFFNNLEQIEGLRVTTFNLQEFLFSPLPMNHPNPHA